MSNSFLKYGVLIGTTATLVCGGILGYAILLLTTQASTALSPANLRGEMALTTDSRIFAHARSTKEQRADIESRYFTKGTLVKMFDAIEQIRQKTGVTLVVDSVLDNGPVRKVAAAVSEEDDAPGKKTKQKPAVTQTPQGLGSVRIGMTIHAEQRALMQTISLIEHIPAAIQVSAVTLKQGEKGGKDEGGWVAVIGLDIQTLPEVANQ
jgi:hypothetical protein